MSASSKRLREQQERVRLAQLAVEAKGSASKITLPFNGRMASYTREEWADVLWRQQERLIEMQAPEIPVKRAWELPQ
jgi:predicted component of type VI protein secretion system